jgi:hypothetical protein
MKFLIFDPSEQHEETRQQIEQIERTWFELKPDEANAGTAKRLADLEAEHATLAAALPPAATTSPLADAIEAQIEEVKNLKIQSQIAATLEPLKAEDGSIDCDAAIAKLRELKASIDTSELEAHLKAKEDGGQTT